MKHGTYKCPIKMMMRKQHRELKQQLPFNLSNANPHLKRSRIRRESTVHNPRQSRNPISQMSTGMTIHNQVPQLLAIVCHPLVALSHRITAQKEILRVIETCILSPCLIMEGTRKRRKTEKHLGLKLYLD